ncbi:MAG: hypothetical protein C0522_05215 [Rhodocyclaceae bacterium]|jgi:drug/metabolite transporter (DMT)-like permease|nr:hypothetical protein [Rhodocyclaceae bacterium]
MNERRPTGTSSGRSHLDATAMLVMVVLCASWGLLFLPGERLRLLQWVGLACAFAGVVAAFAVALPLASMALGEPGIVDPTPLVLAMLLVGAGIRLVNRPPK